MNTAISSWITAQTHFSNKLGSFPLRMVICSCIDAIRQTLHLYILHR